MANKQQELNLFTYSMGSTDSYSEKSISSSAQKRVTKLTLFHDLLQNPKTEDSSLSDCESGISGPENEQKNNIFYNGLIKIQSGAPVFEIIKKKFVPSFCSYGFSAEIESISRNDYSCIMNQVKQKSFGLYSKGLEIKRGHANVMYAWYGASKNEIKSILSNGFSFPFNTGLYGRGVYLSPADHSVESMQSSTPDENGIRHMLLCRVILGKSEIIHPGSGQCHPSSDEFDSGIDNLVSPKKYIIWNGNINTHVLPEFLVSFKASSNCRGCHKILHPRIPHSEWMPFATLINDLSKYLPSDAIKLITKHHCDYKKQKMTRNEMIQRVRNIAGDKLLITIIKSYRGKGKIFHTCQRNQMKILY